MANAFIPADNIKSLEEYGACLITSMMSIRSMETYHIQAYEEGLFNTEEEELSKSICWELRRLMTLYTQLTEMIGERCEIDESTVLTALSTLTRKRKKKS